MLPPMPPEDQPQDEIKVKERNLFLVFINGRGDIMAGAAGKQEAIDLRQLKDRTKEFILNPLDDENLPEKANKDIELPDGGKWVYPVSEGVVSLQTTRDTGYQSYIMVQNELTRAFNEVRDLSLIHISMANASALCLAASDFSVSAASAARHCGGWG